MKDWLMYCFALCVTPVTFGINILTKGMLDCSVNVHDSMLTAIEILITYHVRVHARTYRGESSRILHPASVIKPLKRTNTAM